MIFLAHIHENFDIKVSFLGGGGAASQTQIKSSPGLKTLLNWESVLKLALNPVLVLISA